VFEGLRWTSTLLSAKTLAARARTGTTKWNETRSLLSSLASPTAVTSRLIRRFLLAGAQKASHYFCEKEKMTSDKFILRVIVLLGVVASATGGVSQPAAVTWPEAIAQLTGERAKAETCVALLKKYGDDAERARGLLTYTDAKADADAVIAGLIVGLSAGEQPTSLSVLQTKLSSSHSGLAEFCGTAAGLVPSASGQKDILIDITKAAIVPLLKMLSDSVSALYTNHRADDALTRRTIQTQLEAARWPEFSEVKAAQ
jgi:hypothetical protein